MEEIRPGYTRISTVLDYFLEPDLVAWMIAKGKDAKKISRQALKIGTEVDISIKEFVSSGKYGKLKTLESKSCLEGFRKWYDDYRPTLKVGERIYDDSHLITGEPDLFWGERILDIKCASAIRQKYHVQTGIYAFMSRLNSTGILRLHKQLGDYEYIERDEIEDDWKIFLDMLRVYRYFNPSPLADKLGEQHDPSPSYKTV